MRSYVPKLNTKLFAGLRTQTGHQTGLPCPKNIRQITNIRVQIQQKCTSQLREVLINTAWTSTGNPKTNIVTRSQHPTHTCWGKCKSIGNHYGHCIHYLFPLYGLMSWLLAFNETFLSNEQWIIDKIHSAIICHIFLSLVSFIHLISVLPVL